MTIQETAELKRKLRAEGFEIYRTQAGHIQLAERVRDNLIMDSGIAVELQTDGEPTGVLVTVRAQASHFPGADDTTLRAEARKLAAPYLEIGYSEEESSMRPVPDPSDPAHSLDTSHEVRIRRAVSSEEDLWAELHAALALKRNTSDD